MDDGRDDAAPPGAWVVVEDPAADLDAMLAEVGLVYRLPVPAGPRADRLRPGDPCFLYRTNRSRVVGIWAVGEVVGATSDLPVSPRHRGSADDRARRYTEVELLPLRKPIPLERLRGDRVLDESELVVQPPESPWMLTRAERRALEAQDFELVDPTPDQVAALDALLAAEDDAAPPG